MPLAPLAKFDLVLSFWFKAHFGLSFIGLSFVSTITNFCDVGQVTIFIEIWKTFLELSIND